MNEISRFSLGAIADTTPMAEATLLRDGQPTGVRVPGCVLEAQFQGSLGTLLFLTHDIPFEEQLEIVLLTQAGGIADRAWLSGAMTTGNFRDPVVLDDETIDFSFFGGRRWRVHVLSHASLRLPFFSMEPLGVHRAPGWRRHFTVRHAN